MTLIQAEIERVEERLNNLLKDGNEYEINTTKEYLEKLKEEQ